MSVCLFLCIAPILCSNIVQEYLFFHLEKNISAIYIPSILIHELIILFLYYSTNFKFFVETWQLDRWWQVCSLHPHSVIHSGLGSIPFFQFNSNSNSVIFNSNSNSTTHNKFQFQFQFQFQRFQFQFQFQRFQIPAISIPAMTCWCLPWNRL